MGQFDESRLDELLDRFQDLLDEGGSPSVAELCRNCPELRDELARRVARLARVGRLFEDDPPAPATQPAAGPRSISSDKTWVSHAGEGVSVVEIPAPPGYEVLEVLGEGGMGVVYKALQVSLNRVVALKMILPGARARPVDLDRFRAEARAIAALRHPNIVQVYETGEFRGLPFFSLEFCEGGPLSAILKGEPQPPRAAAEAAEVLARAVQYAHEHGIVHRDLKPGNILLTSTFQVPSSKSTARNTAVTDRIRGKLELSTWNQELKVTDFGLAKRVDDDSGMTQHGSVMGTPAYMSPEQAFGDTRDVTVAADVHALGAVLYELLTGRPPFQGSSVHETLEQVRHRDPVPVRRLQPKVPADLETICLKCLEKDPRKRYVGAADLADDLRRFLDGRPITARPVGRLAYAWRWARREPKTATLFAVGTLLAIGLPALLVGVQVRLSDSAKLLEQEQLAEAAARESADTQKYYAAISEAR
ncbi:MAG TPA: serine/threonine-protein kinase, partial [Gemmataceae bacterium]|nr:serine/threonine-protein kinase [Gemmataceae bacterium]